MKTSPILGLPIEQMTDIRRDFPSRVDEPRTTALEKFTVPRFANIAERNSRIPAPANGMMCFLSDTATLQMHNGYVWVGDTEWTTLTPANGWTAHPALPWQLRMDYRGMVSMVGILNGIAATSDTIGAVPSVNVLPIKSVWSVQYHANAAYTAFNTAAVALTNSGQVLFIPAPGARACSELGIYVHYWADFKAVR